MWWSLPAWRRVTFPVGVDAVGADPVVGVGWQWIWVGRATPSGTPVNLELEKLPSAADAIA
jgi:hypothetical protein